MRSRDLRARLLALALATLVAVEAEAPPPPGLEFLWQFTYIVEKCRDGSAILSEVIEALPSGEMRRGALRD